MILSRPATIFLKMALRRAAHGTGSTPDFFERRTAMQAIPDLHTILAPIPWVLVGGIALRAYIPERMTQDVDILVHERDAVQVQAKFIRAEYQLTGLPSIGGFSMELPQQKSPPIDVLVREDSWLDSALNTPSHDEAGYPILARPYLLLLKLQDGRTQDLADIQRLLAYRSSNERDTMRQIIEQESPELVEDFDALCVLADLEFGHPKE